MKTCFIAMPITCPEGALAQYRNDKDHFRHVLEHLFIPAIEKAELQPIPPIASGSDLIHAEIIKQLESTDLVLCDMTLLNANVFFELGIRTAVDKPICLVKDIYTDKVPFDTGVLNHHSYEPCLSPWKLANEIQHLTEHILASLNRSQGRNTLWKYFSMTQKAELTPPTSPIEEKLDYILSKFSDMEKPRPPITQTPSPSAPRSLIIKWIFDRANAIAGELNASFSSAKVDENACVLDLGGFALPPDYVSRIEMLGNAYGISIKVENNLHDTIGTKKIT